MQNKEIEKLLSCDNCPFHACEGCEITWTDRKKIKEHIDKLENKVKELEKENMEIKIEITEQVYFGSIPLDQIRELQAKANKYDSLIKKIKETNKQTDKKIKENNKIINMEWLDTHMAMDDYFARKHKLMRENEILEMKKQYTKELLEEK